MRFRWQVITKFTTCLVVGALVSNQSAVAAIKLGARCKTVGVVQASNGNHYVCTKSKNKLVWRKKLSVLPPENKIVTWAEIYSGKYQQDLGAKPSLEKIESSEGVNGPEIFGSEIDLKKDLEIIPKVESIKPKIQGLVIGNLLWIDDFKGEKGTQINSQYWSSRNCHRVSSTFGGGACFDAEAMLYAPSQITLDGSEDGAAIISTNRVSGPLPADAGSCLTDYCPFISGRFDTHGKVAFQFGFIEARIKMPSGSGNHPAFWMLGDNINQVGWPTSGEMDITEIRGNQPTFVTSATHYSTSYLPNTCCDNHQYKVTSLELGVDLSKDFHTYAIAWLPNSISYYIDGELISTTTPQNLAGHWSFNDRFFLILNNAVNASFSGPWNELVTSSMTIDWVRSYELNGQGSVFVK
jgi:hypothetical protein